MLSMHRTSPLFAIAALGTQLTFVAFAIAPSNADELETIRRRIVTPMLQTPKNAEVQRLIDSMQPDGNWVDIDYANKDRAVWAPMLHLRRLRVLAQACRGTKHAASADRNILAATNRSLDYWLRLDPQNPNWWWNQIGVPQTLLPILLLLDDELSAQQRAGGLKILQRAKISMTGQNLVWVTEITAGRGLLEHDAALVAKAYRRIADEIRVSTDEGIQSDFSFHQHGPCLYSHGYGAGFIVDCAQIATQVEGTTMAFPREKIELLAHLILDGTQWMTRGTATDFGAEGREITRKGQSARHLAVAAHFMLKLPTGRDKEFRDLEARATGSKSAPPLVGNRYFWCSDFMTHHRPQYYASARMHSKRLANTDGPANSEGLLSHHLADGCFVLMRDGREYNGIFGVWDWQKIPGTTVEQKKQLSGSPRRMGTTELAGGVSDGNYGMAAYDFARDSLVARKSWFFFDQEIVCLGAGIRCDSDRPVVTTINQCLLRGEVVQSAGGKLRTLDRGRHEPQQVDYIWHDSVAYIPLEQEELAVQNCGQTGNWYAASHSHPDRPETKDIFAAWIDHGTRPEAAHYAYAVVPAIDLDQVARYREKPAYHVLSNTRQLQAVEHRQLGLVAAAFYQPGELTSQSGLRINVDQPCLVLARRAQESIVLTVSDPRNRATKVHVQLRCTTNPSLNRDVVVALPGGDRAGSSVRAGQPIN